MLYVKASSILHFDFLPSYNAQYSVSNFQLPYKHDHVLEQQDLKTKGAI